MKQILSFLFIIGVYIHPSNAQTSNFTADVTTGCAPLTVKFSDTSVGSPNTWSWTFGNGNSSSLQNPSAIYTQPGVYAVSLTVTNASGSDTETKAGFIVVHALPSVEFDADIKEGCAPLEVHFTDLSNPVTGTIQSWEWIFGDGNTSTEQSPTHIFTQNGKHNITLRVRNTEGCESVKTKLAFIDSRKPNTLFSVNATEFCSLPANVTFTNQTVGVGSLTYAWDFGDGNVSAATSPIHSYTTAGNFTSKLITTDAEGCKSEYTKVINVLEQLEADLVLTKSKICIGDTIQVEDHTSGPVLSRLWDFGDGRISTLQTQKMPYTIVGVYPITLTVQMADGCTAQKTEMLEVLPLPVPNFTTAFSCDFKAEFTNTSLNSESWLWSFGNGLTSNEKDPVVSFSSRGNRAISLKAINEIGCETILVKNITVPDNPQANFIPNDKSRCGENAALEGCAPFNVTFINKSTSPRPYTSKWFFGDGDSSSLQEPTHIFTQPGTYTVKLEITDNTGCKSTFTSIARIGSTPPHSDVEISKFSVCVGEEIQIRDKLNEANFWCWSMGDDQYKTGQSIVYTYNEPGLYTITLFARKDGCGAPLVLENIIEVKEPLVSFEVSKDCDLTKPNTFNFINAAVVDKPEEVWLWDFGDGETSNDLQAQHEYAQEGTYTVSLTGSNSSTGCSITKGVEVFSYAVTAEATVSQSIVCKEVDLIFTNSSQNAASYKWQMGDGKSYTDKDIVHTFENAGDYNVRLTNTDRYGCTAIDTIAVKVIDIEGKFDQQLISDCNVLDVTFTDQSVSDQGITAWLWNFGNGQTSTEQNPSHQYNSPGVYSISLVLTDGLGVQCTVLKEDIINFTVPIADFLSNENEGCIGQDFDFINLSTNASAYEWNFNNGHSDTSKNAQTHFENPGVYDIALTITDDYGCSKTITKNNEIEIRQPAASFQVSKISAECPPLISDFTDNSVGDITAWAWDFGDGNHSTLTNPTHVFSTAGNFEVSLTVTDDLGCSHTQIFNQLIEIGGPIGNFQLETEICISDTITFSSESINTEKHYWDFGDGNVVETATKNIKYKYTNKGNYKPALILEDQNGCQVAMESPQTLVVNPLPFNNLFISEPFPFLGDQVKVRSIISSGGYQQNWYQDGVFLGQGNTTSFTPTETGKIIIGLETIDQKGCVLYLEKEVIVQDDISFIPNAFSPNGDGFNPTFSIGDLEEGSWQLLVYNRWGKKVFEAKPYQGDWSAQNLHAGTYFYQLQNMYRPEKLYRGSVQVIK